VLPAPPNAPPSRNPQLLAPSIHTHLTAGSGGSTSIPCTASHLLASVRPWRTIARVSFAIDACDREIIAWSATTAGISGEMVRDLIVACVKRRFGISKAPQAVEWLSDNDFVPMNRGLIAPELCSCLTGR
jgi:transposase InsO family protein